MTGKSPPPVKTAGTIEQVGDGTREPNEQDWLATRDSGVGGSDASAILGVSRWRSAYELWAEKLGIIERDDKRSEAALWGVILEGPVRDEYARRTGRHVITDPPYTVRRHADHPFILGSVDGLVYDEERGWGVYEGKTASAYLASKWDEGPPIDYWVQGQHYLAITGLSWVSFAALIGGQDFRTFDLPRDEEFIALLIREVTRFWEHNIKAGNPPEIDGSAATTAVLGQRFQGDSGEEVSLPSEADDWDIQREEAIAEMADCEKRKREAENRIKAAIGDATHGRLPNERATYSWKAHMRGGKPVRQLRRSQCQPMKEAV